METAPSYTADYGPRWFHPTPARLLIVLLAVEGILLLSKPWFPKGYAVLVAIAAVGGTMLLMLIWWLAALCFRWRFQFSIRSLLVLSVAVAIPFSWLAVEMRAAGQQKMVVETVHGLRGRTVYDYEYSSASTSPPGPNWLRKLLGDDFFANVTCVLLEDPLVTDAGLECLSRLTQLQSLYLSNTQVTDAGLERLKGLSQLHALFLVNTHVTDAGLRHLKGLSQLKTLDLSNSHVADAGLVHLQGLRQLNLLAVSGTAVSDAGLEHLQGMSQLRILYVTSTKVTDQGKEKFQRTLPECDIRRW